MRAVTLQPLTAEAFTPFGDVIDTASAKKQLTINDGYTQRYHDLASVDTSAGDGKTIVNIFRSTPMALPLKIERLERHPLSSQAFFPVGDQPYIVIVARKGDLDESQIRCFLARSDQGVNYHAGTWHHFSLALNKVSDFLVIDRGGQEKNCDEQTLATPLVIHLEDIQRVTQT